MIQNSIYIERIYILEVMTEIISQFGAESPAESLIIMLIGLFIILMGVFEIVATRRRKMAAGQAGVSYIKFSGKVKHIPWNVVKDT